MHYSMNSEQKYALSFADIVIPQEFICEIIPKKGIEIDRWENIEFDNFLSSLKQPLGLLLNRKHCFSFTFDGLQQMLASPHINAAAFLAHDATSFAISCSDAQMILQTQKPVQSFLDKKDAMAWLATTSPCSTNQAFNTNPDSNLYHAERPEAPLTSKL